MCRWVLKIIFLLELSLLADICSCFLHLDSGIFRHLIWKTRHIHFFTVIKRKVYLHILVLVSRGVDTLLFVCNYVIYLLEAHLFVFLPWRLHLENILLYFVPFSLPHFLYMVLKGSWSLKFTFIEHAEPYNHGVCLNNRVAKPALYHVYEKQYHSAYTHGSTVYFLL